MWTLVLGDVLAVFLQNVYFHGSTLGEAHVADVAFVGLLTCDTVTKRTLCRVASPTGPDPHQRTPKAESLSFAP